MRVIAQRTWRIGVLRLWEEGGRYFVRCTNRTYDQTYEIPAEKLRRWVQLIRTGR